MPFCHKCVRPIKSLGIMRHRAMHRDRREDVEITYADGTYEHHFSQLPGPAIYPKKLARASKLAREIIGEAKTEDAK